MTFHFELLRKKGKSDEVNLSFIFFIWIIIDFTFIISYLIRNIYAGNSTWSYNIKLILVKRNFKVYQEE